LLAYRTGKDCLDKSRNWHNPAPSTLPITSTDPPPGPRVAGLALTARTATVLGTTLVVAVPEVPFGREGVVVVLAVPAVVAARTVGHSTFVSGPQKVKVATVAASRTTM
jgi:hypothetical protein